MSGEPTAAGRSTLDWNTVDEAVRAFKASWDRDEKPVIESFLPAAAGRAAIAKELVLADMEFRYQHGEEVWIEKYLQRFPELTGQPQVIAELIAAELACRRRVAAKDSTVELLADRLEALKRDYHLDGTAFQFIHGATSPFTAAQAIPGYVILEEIGRGSMGVVYKARHQKLNRQVAIKMLQPGAAGAQERFRIEAEAVARLKHPNIVQIHEVGDVDQRPYFSLELVEGGSLLQRMGSPWPAAAAAELIEVLARAIHAAHLEKVVHRDLKPANILLTPDGVPKITDFGLAKLLESDQGDTHTGQILGTPSYMAPEQAEGRSRDVSPASDVYALGAILYELLTGTRPFAGVNLLDTIRQVVAEEPVPPSRLQARVPRDLETICLKCLEKNPHRRYATAQELADDLRRFRQQEPITARQTPMWERCVRWMKRYPEAALVRGAIFLMVTFFLFRLTSADWIMLGSISPSQQMYLSLGKIMAFMALVAALFAWPRYGIPLLVCLSGLVVGLSCATDWFAGAYGIRFQAYFLTALVIGAFSRFVAHRTGGELRVTVFLTYAGALLAYLPVTNIVLLLGFYLGLTAIPPALLGALFGAWWAKSLTKHPH